MAEPVGFNLDRWPAGTRAIVHQERPHPGAQLTYTDIDGHRPFGGYIVNEAWLQLIPVTMELTAWTQHLCLHSAPAAAEPKKLR